METKPLETKPLPEEGMIECPETHPSAKTNLVEMSREEIGMVVRNFFTLLDQIEGQNSN